MNFRKKSTGLILTVTVALAGFSALQMNSAFATQDRDELVKRQQEQSQRIGNLRSSLEGVDLNLQQTFIELEETRAKIPAAEAALLEAQNELSAANREAEQKAALLQAAEDELAGIAADKKEAQDGVESTKSSLGELARSTYRGETGPSALDLILGSADAQEFLNSYRINNAITRTQTAALTIHEQETATILNREARQSAVQAAVEQLKAEADELVARKEAATAQAESVRNELNSLKAQMEAKSKELESRKSEYEASLANAQKEHQSVTAEIAALDAEIRRKAEEERRRLEAQRAREAEAARRAGQQSTTTTVPTTPSTGSSGSGNYGSGMFGTPVPKPLVITSPFGWRSSPFGGRSELHAGVDLRAQCGVPQVATMDGTVYKLERQTLGGNVLWISHGMRNGATWITRHAHLSQFNVSTGQQIRKGQVIGLTGKTGMVTGCHVHYEIWKNGTPLNPMSFMG
ncbi:MAG: peptidoglycan DD-metalloendopeptidase family protein [Arcanobacterium sp.]|nr:peptidoglycan DD-metalloendopeptidase family protein [Arcanobacterium sp.]